MDLRSLTETCVDALCKHVIDAATSHQGHRSRRRPCGVVVDPKLASLFAYASPAVFMPLSSASSAGMNTSIFAKAGAMREFTIDSTATIDWNPAEGPLVFFLRPDPATCRTMAAQIRALLSYSSVRPELRAVFIPRRSFRCEQVLKQENVHALFSQGFHGVSLGFVNVEPDLVSLEMEDFIRDTRAEGDLTPYTFVARALLDLGDVSLSKIKGKGFAAKEVLDLYRRMRVELDETRGKTNRSDVSFPNGGNAPSPAASQVGEGGIGGDELDSHASSSSGLHMSNSGSSGGGWQSFLEDDLGEDESDQFRMVTQMGGPLDRLGGFPRVTAYKSPLVDSIIVLDRELDMISPLLTPLTYESLLDESFNGIKPGFLLGVNTSVLRLDESQQQQQQQQENESYYHRSTEESVWLELKDDPIFRLIRSESVFGVMQILNAQARELKEEQERVHRVTDPQELQLIVQRVPELQQKKRKLATHIAISQKLTAMTLDRRNRATIDAERKLIFDVDGRLLLDRALDCAARNESLLKVLRLCCLACMVSGGFDSSKLDEIRRDIVHAYGFQTVLSLDYLERIGMLAERPFHPQHKFAQAERARQGRSMPSCIYPNWELVKQNFQLSVDEAKSKDDCSYVFSGIAPLSARLVELETRGGGWKKHTYALSLLGESPTLWSLERSPGPNQNQSDAINPNERKKTLLVVFLGGVSRAEIAALRFISSRPDSTHRIVVATTALLSGTEMVQACCHPSFAS